MYLDEYMTLTGHDDMSFSAIIGVSPTTVHRWRRRKRRPDSANTVKIFVASGGSVTANDFLPSDIVLSTTSNGYAGADIYSSPDKSGALGE